MRKLTLATLVMALFLGIGFVPADDAKPEFPAPAKEHAWLKQLEGEWESESEMVVAEGQPAMKCKGTEKVRLLGGFWAVSDGEADVFGMKMESVMTLGYDEKEKKYIGTWVATMMSHLWKYEGKLDSTGKILTLDTVGPCPWDEGKTTKFQDIIEIKNKDYRTLTGKFLGEDGKWSTMMVTHYRRKK